MGLLDEGLSLFEAAKVAGVKFSKNVVPEDKAISLNGLRFHYLDWGNPDKPTILLLHGGLQQSHSWDFVALSLCDSYHVIALDARGHGDSDWAPDQDYSLEAHQRDLDAFVKELKLQQYVIIGHSMGGRNAYVFASRHQTGICGLVIVDTGPKTDPRGSTRIRQFRELPDQLSTYHEFAERIHGYTGRPIQHILGALKYTIRQTASGNWTWKYDSALRDPNYQPSTWPESKLWDAISKISVPTLIVRGEKSDIFGVETLDQILESITGSTSATIPNAGHLVPGDNPAAFIEAITAFLANI